MCFNATLDTLIWTGTHMDFRTVHIHTAERIHSHSYSLAYTTGVHVSSNGLIFSQYENMGLDQCLFPLEHIEPDELGLVVIRPDHSSSVSNPMHRQSNCSTNRIQGQSCRSELSSGISCLVAFLVLWHLLNRDIVITQIVLQVFLGQLG